MAESSEQTMELNQCLLNDQIERYLNLENNITMINRKGPYGNIALHVASYSRYNEIIQLFFTNSALESVLENNSYQQSTTYDESKINEIKNLLLTDSNLHYTENEIANNDYIEWSLTANKLIKKRREFREQIDVYKTYDNQHHFITKLLIEIIEYYLNEYLIKQENFSPDQIQKIETCFKKAIEEQNYLKYFIKAYTLTNNFHRVLNKHLALYILHYFDSQSYSSLRTKYRLINCLAHIVTLVINHPDIHKYKYKGITYRGLLVNGNDFKYYSIGNHILNRSFVSTSKDLLIAQTYANNRQENTLSGSLDHHDQIQVSVILKYTIKQAGTAVDIKHMSMIQDEEEVLILPFSVFRVKDRTERCSTRCSPRLIEIDLEECEDKEQINNDEPINNEKHKSE